MGHILWKEITDTDRADEAFRRLRSIDPKNRNALLFFEHVYEEREDWRRLYATLAQRIGMETEDDVRADIAKRMAKIAANQMEDSTRALESWKRALRFAPDDPEVQVAITALYRETGKWHALVDFLNTQINAISDDKIDAKVALLFRLIEIYQDSDRIPSQDMVTKT
jgi:lipopolysaccharide biosynthesis regulator YciM